MLHTTVNISLINKDITVLSLANLIRRATSNSYSPTKAIDTARHMINGLEWIPPYEVVAYGLNTMENQPWVAKIDTPEDPYASQMQQRMDEYARGEELAREGAAGNHEAAIEFCKMFLDGAMNNSAMG